jgi:hypothetical protein
MYQKNKQWVVSGLIALAVTLAGCSSSPETKQNTANAEMQAELNEWKRMKPGVQRLVAIETELKVLLQTLETAALEPTDQLQTADTGPNVQSAVIERVQFDDKRLTPEPATANAPSLSASNPSAPMVQTIVKPGVSESASETTSPAPMTAAVQEQSPTNFSLQLASVTEPAAVESTWQRLQERYPDVLSDLDLHSEEVIVSNRTYFRVKAGSFESYDEAKRQCSELRKSGASCIVNKG